MEWLDLSLWIVVVVFIITGEVKSLARAIFLIFIFLIRSINHISNNKENLDFILMFIPAVAQMQQLTTSGLVISH